MDERKYILLRGFVVSFSIFLGIMLNRYFMSARFKADIAECKRRKQLRIAERTLDIKLYKWQREYVLYKGASIPTSVRTARCTGKTFAQCLKICLSEGEPLDIRYLDYNKVDGYSVREDEYLWWQIDLYEDKETRQRYHYFVVELFKMYQILSSNKKLKLRPIKFHEIRF